MGAQEPETPQIGPSGFRQVLALTAV